MQFPTYSAFRGLKAGAIGGIVGALVLGILAGLSAFVLDQEVFYVTIAGKLGLPSPFLSGWALHFIVGIVAGGSFIFHLVYGVVTALVSLSLIRRSVRTKAIVIGR